MRMATRQHLTFLNNSISVTSTNHASFVCLPLHCSILRKTHESSGYTPFLKRKRIPWSREVASFRKAASFHPSLFVCVASPTISPISIPPASLFVRMGMSQDDLDCVSRIRTSIFDDGHIHGACRLRDTTSDSLVFVAIDSVSGNIVGCIEATPSSGWAPPQAGRSLYLSSLAVLPQYRRMGVSTALINACIEYATNLEFNALFLHVMRNNLPAVASYAKMGFEFSAYVPLNLLLLYGALSPLEGRIKHLHMR